MNKYAEINHKWEDLWNLAHETEEYKLGITDNLHIINHFRNLAEDEARDYDTITPTREKYERQGNQEEVARWDKELLKHETRINELEQQRKRLINKINRTDQPRMAETKTTISCPCDTSKLERELKEKIDNIKFPAVDYGSIFEVVRGSSLTSATIKELIADNNPVLISELISKLPAVKEQQPVEEVKAEPIKEEPKKALIELTSEEQENQKWQEKITNAELLHELSNLKNEIGKGNLTESEKEMLNEAKTKWQAEEVQKSIRSRIEREKKEAWNKLTPEQRNQKIIDKIFDADKNIISKATRTDFNYRFYNNFSDFNNASSPQNTVHNLLYECKSGKYGVLERDSKNPISYYWHSPSNSAERDGEVEEIKKLFPSRNVYNVSAWDTNKENSVRYSLLWSLAFIRNKREAWDNVNSDLMKNENNWLPQMEKEFADAEKL